MLLALDPGTVSTGYALFLDSTLKEAGSIQADKKLGRYERTQIILSNLKLYLSSGEIESIYCEEPVLRGQASVCMNRLLGGLEAITLLKINYIRPTSVKKAMGHGALTKLEVLESVKKILSKKEIEVLEDRADFDMIDSIAVGLAALGRGR